FSAYTMTEQQKEATSGGRALLARVDRTQELTWHTIHTRSPLGHTVHASLLLNSNTSQYLNLSVSGSPASQSVSAPPSVRLHAGFHSTSSLQLVPYFEKFTSFHSSLQRIDIIWQELGLRACVQ
ncbi:Aspartyl/glutamyl-tRNA(Asn/Gln) amidotransferase subunit B, partial [Dissostichus eleginoides]